MARRFLLLCAAAALLPGCVPVTEPLSDVNKAEPDRRLVGTWKEEKDRDPSPCRIDTPDVKGNPKRKIDHTDPAAGTKVKPGSKITLFTVAPDL